MTFWRAQLRQMDTPSPEDYKARVEWWNSGTQIRELSLGRPGWTTFFALSKRDSIQHYADCWSAPVDRAFVIEYFGAKALEGVPEDAILAVELEEGA